MPLESASKRELWEVLLTTHSEPAAVFDADLVCRAWNQPLVALLHRSAPLPDTLSLREFVLEDARVPLEARFREILAGAVPAPHNFEVALRGAPPLAVTLLAVTLPEGDAGVLMLGRQRSTPAPDQERHELIALRRALKTAGLGVWRIDPNMSRVLPDPTLLELLGVAPDGEFGAFDQWLEQVPEGELDKVKSTIKDLLTGQKDRFSYRHQFRHADGRMLWLEVWGERILVEGEAIIYGVTQNITSRHLQEERQHDSEALHRALVENPLVGVTLFQDGQVLFANTAASAMLGLLPEEVTGMPLKVLASYFHPEDRGRFGAMLEARLRGDRIPNRYSLRLVPREGSERWVEINSCVVDRKGRPAIQTYVHDITPQKQHEQETNSAIAHSQRRYQGLFDGLGGMVLAFGLEDELIRLHDCNRKAERTFSISREQILGLRLADALPWLDIPPLLEAVIRVGRDHRPERLHRLHLQLGDRILWYDCYLIDLEDDEVVAVLEDITERVEAEIALQRSEERYRVLFEHAGIGLSYFDNDGNLLLVNAAGRSMFGLGETEVRGRSVFDLFERERAGAMMSRLYRTTSARQPLSFADVVPAERGQAELEHLAVPVLAGGEVVGIQLFSHDVTARRRAEEELRSNEQRYRALFEGSQDAILFLDQEGLIQDSNPATRHLLGWNRRELRGRHLGDLHAASRNEQLREMLTSFRRNRKIHYETALVTKEGCELETSVALSLIDPRQGLALALVRNISRRKDAERGLREQVFFLQQLIDAIPNPIFYKDVNGRYLGCNANFLRYLGRRRDEVLGATVFDLYPAELAAEYFRKDQELFADPGIQVYECQVVTAEGKIHEVVFNKATFLDRYGKVGGVVGIVLDLTEAKSIQRELEQSLRHFRTLFETAGEGILLIDRTSLRILQANRSAGELFGYGDEEFLTLTMQDLHPPEFKAILLASFQLHSEMGRSETVELPCMRKDGSSFLARVNAKPVELDGRTCNLAFFSEVLPAHDSTSFEVVKEREGT
ncbi:MAG: hypothetical protein A2284_10145 [Deltaproteobacteria bacterium RIFOXYA12_FULL_61_11]|nr:MAG: hypothetical protein A2284_10145 [Deltaproteobacteria bacterium RIFOXYA12_FULL_61_11]